MSNISDRQAADKEYFRKLGFHQKQELKKETARVMSAVVKRIHYAETRGQMLVFRLELK